MRAVALSGARTVSAAGRDFAGRLAAVEPWRVVAAFVVAQWAVVVGVALVVRHNGWVYYQGGDQLWYYTLGWLFGHGSFTEPLVGYLWSIVLAPFALIGGSNLVSALPGIVIFNVVVLAPVAVIALYGLARMIAGRLFAYWVLLLWIFVPLIAIRFTDTGYHQRFTEILLPQGLGLTAMADFPTMVAVLVAAYFCARVVFDDDAGLWDAGAAGVAASAAIALKPSAALFLAGPPLAMLVARRWRAAGAFLAALAPAVITLAVWKYRGYGYLPLLHSLGAPTRSAAGPQLTAVAMPHYFHFDWSHFTKQLDLLREHFWSGRLIEWFVIGGAIGVALLSRRAFVLVVGWFAAFVLVKAGSGGTETTSIEDTNLLRILMPAYPAFVLLLASLPFLLPGFARRVAAAKEPAPRRLGQRGLAIGVGVGLLATAIVPLAVIAAASPVTPPSPRAVAVQQPPLPFDVHLGVRARHSRAGTTLAWTPQHPAGGAVFYHVFRAPAGTDNVSCPATTPAPLCFLQMTDLGATRSASFVDRPGKGRWTYRVGVAANWLNDPTQGDVYEVSEPVTG